MPLCGSLARVQLPLREPYLKEGIGMGRRGGGRDFEGPGGEGQGGQGRRGGRGDFAGGPGGRGHGGGARGERWDDLRNEREEFRERIHATGWTTSTIVWTG